MTLYRVAVLLVVGLGGVSRGLDGQQLSVTLADAVRLAERVQPLVVRAAGDIETTAAQRRSAWGSYLPSLSANSSASTFSSEGPSRVDPVTGQLVSGNSSNRSLNTALSASLDLFTGFRRGAEMGAARANQDAAEASYVDARFEQALTTTNQFLDALASRQLVAVRETSVRRAEEQLKTSIAKLQAGSATRSDSLRSRVTLGSAQLDLIRAQTAQATAEAFSEKHARVYRDWITAQYVAGAPTAQATAEAGLARLIGETGRVRALDDSAFYRIVEPPDTAALLAALGARLRARTQQGTSEGGSK